MNSLIKKICAAFIAITTMSTAVAITQPNQSVVYAKKRMKTINIKSVILLLTKERLIN